MRNMWQELCMGIRATPAVQLDKLLQVKRGKRVGKSIKIHLEPLKNCRLTLRDALVLSLATITRTSGRCSFKSCIRRSQYDASLVKSCSRKFPPLGPF